MQVEELGVEQPQNTSHLYSESERVKILLQQKMVQEYCSDKIKNMQRHRKQSIPITNQPQNTTRC